MTFDELYIDPAFMRSGNAELNEEEFDDDALKELNRTASLEDLRTDVLNALGLVANSIGLAQLDIVANTYETTLQKALAYKQLQRYFLSTFQGYETKSAQKMRHCETMYEQLKAGFSKLVTSSNKPATVTKIKRG